MVKYYKADKVKKFGTKCKESDQYTTVNPDHTLIAILDKGFFVMAGDVTAKADFEFLYNDYSRGNAFSFKLYDIPTEKLGECEDTLLYQ